jgi:hypothetical protein
VKGYSLLAPIPRMHLDGAVDILAEKEFALFGSESFDVFEKTDVGTKVLIYVSHDQADPLITYEGRYGGLVGDPMEMRRLEKQGFRPHSTVGEKWAFYWKITDLKKLDTPIPFSEIQLASGGYLKGYPRGPLHIRN